MKVEDISYRDGDVTLSGVLVYDELMKRLDPKKRKIAPNKNRAMV